MDDVIARFGHPRAALRESGRVCKWRANRLPPSAILCAAAIVAGACQASHVTSGAPAASSASRFFETRGVRIHYRESPAETGGDGVSLLLVHGFGGSSETWNDILSLLTRTFPTTRLDLKGFGLSDKPSHSNYSIDEQAEIVASFVESVMRPPVVLVGHSYGGAVVLLAYAKLHDRGAAGRVAGLVLVDAAAYEQKLPFFVRDLTNPVTRFIAERLTTVDWRTRFVLRRLFVDRSKVDDERVEKYAKYLRLPGAEASIASVARQILPPNASSLSARLPDLDRPTLVIWGDSDTAIPLALGRRLAGDISGASLIIVPHSGHMPHEEQPAMTAAAIVEFVGKRIRVP